MCVKEGVPTGIKDEIFVFLHIHCVHIRIQVFSTKWDKLKSLAICCSPGIILGEQQLLPFTW